MSTTTLPAAQFVTSADGTRIAYEVSGHGPALICVDGAMCQRVMGPSRVLGAALQDQFTVYVYDRRGRSESGPGGWPYEIDREVEDLRAIIDAAGDPAHVLGVSSGAALALEAARQGSPIDRLAVYEAPFMVDGTHVASDLRLPERTKELVDAGRRGDAVRLFLRTVGMPAAMVPLMRLMPSWKDKVARPITANSPPTKPFLGSLGPTPQPGSGTSTGAHDLDRDAHPTLPRSGRMGFRADVDDPRGSPQ